MTALLTTRRAEYHVGNALFDLGQYDKAELYWLRALELFSRENETHPTTNAAKIKLSTIKMKRGDFEEAMYVSSRQPLFHVIGS